jgi:hypothetical protein
MTRKPTSTGTRVALRIADGPGPAFLTAAADEVLRVAGANVVLIVSVHAPPPAASGSRRSNRIDRLYSWLEGRLLRGSLAATAARPPIEQPPGVPRLSDPTPDGLATALAAAEAEVLVDLGPDEVADSLPSLPGGRWRLRFSNGIGGVRRSRLDRPLDDVAFAESLLSIETGPDQTQETEIGVSALHRIGFSRDRDAVYWRAALLPARRLARLVADDALPTRAVDAAAAVSPAAVTPGQRTPPLFASLCWRMIEKVVDRAFFRTTWTTFVHDREPNGEPPSDLSGFTMVEPPPGRYYADPFVVATADGHRMYVEDSELGKHRGRISTLRMVRNGEWQIERIVLNDLEHRAYPHVIPVDGGLLLTPDSGRGTGVDLFLEPGPSDRPTLIGHRLENMSVSDPTVLWHDGRFWLFVTTFRQGMNSWDELHLYSAASLSDVWQPHPWNPIVADVRRARSAGRIFRRGDELIRPGQDCSRDYGHRISLSVITTLTPDAYEEHPIGFIEPTGFPGVRRTHTYTFDGSIEALDGYRRVARRPRLRRRRD